jgi:hypothetical protein
MKNINGHNERVSQSIQQESPKLAQPSDFTINPPDTNEEYPFHGQIGDNQAQCDQLLRVGGLSRGEQNAVKGKTNAQVAAEKEAGRRSPAPYPASWPHKKQVGE